MFSLVLCRHKRCLSRVSGNFTSSFSDGDISRERWVIFCEKIGAIKVCDACEWIFLLSLCTFLRHIELDINSKWHVPNSPRGAVIALNRTWSILDLYRSGYFILRSIRWSRYIYISSAECECRRVRNVDIMIPCLFHFHMTGLGITAVLSAPRI